MDDFNAKKSRANKLRQDKYRDKPKKHSVHSGPTAEKTNVHVKSQGNSSGKDEKAEAPNIQLGDVDESEVPNPIFSRRKLTSNWDRYEESLEPSRHDQDDDNCGANFEELLAMPTSGGHMKLKHEHVWEREKSELQLPWFQLDTQSLEKNLSTIPFLNRQNLPPSIFSKAQLLRMTARAKQNSATLNDESLLKIQKLILGKSDGKEKSSNISSTTDTIRLSNEREEFKAIEEQSCDLDDLLALHETSPKPPIRTLMEVALNSPSADDSLVEDSKEVCRSPLPSVSQSTAVSSQPPDSLDDWLDSILDD